MATTEVHAAFVPGQVFYYYHTDHLDSSNVTTDRSGNVIQQHEYSAYGTDRCTVDNAAGHPEYKPTQRFTGQVLDEDTGLYFYGSRYYDPELGRFVQADTIVPSPGAPQTLNRYSYCGNNPLKYVDPTGHFVELIFALLFAVCVGAAAGAVTAAAFGGDIGKAALSGAIGAAFGFVAGPVGGVIGAAVSASISGGDMGTAILGAVIGAGIAYGVGQLGAELLKQGVNRAAVQVTSNVITGAVGGGIAAELAGGDFWIGAAYGVTGAAGYLVIESGYEAALARAGTKFEPGFSDEQERNIRRGMRDLASTKTGQEELWQVVLHGGAHMQPIDSGKPLGGDGIVQIHRSAPGGISTDVRAEFDEYVKQGQLPNYDDAHFWAIFLGHEIGHAFYRTYGDITTFGNRGNNVIWQIENPLRTEYGIPLRFRHGPDPIFNGK
jgi:RHS repeat-associated protein